MSSSLMTPNQRFFCMATVVVHTIIVIGIHGPLIIPLFLSITLNGGLIGWLIIDAWMRNIKTRKDLMDEINQANSDSDEKDVNHE